MNLWLLTWNPEYCDLAAPAEVCAAAGEVEGDWSTQSRRIAAGDRLVLLRQGVEPRGIVAVGYATGRPEVGEDGRWYVTLTFTWLDPENPLVTRTELELGFPTRSWRPQCSGTRIPEPVATMLWERLETRIAQEEAFQAQKLDELFGEEG